MTDRPRFSAAEVCDMVGAYPPTLEQTQIIEAPFEGVYRVVAGAGSGKTETMALRVVWLVANGFVAPRDVLGLTFTKKAATELGSRISERIRALPVVDERAESDWFQMPQVSTYNAFAARLFQDYAVYLGVDGDQEVSGQAAAWALARDVVVRSTHPALDQLDMSVERLTTQVWQLAQSMSENTVSAEQVREFSARFAALAELPPGGPGGYPQVDKYVERVSRLPLLIDLVSEFVQRKQERGMIEYSDQVRLGLEVVRSAPEVVQALRQRHRVVFLDEYQDTSVLQTALLSGLFSDHPVMSVGDPLQAIYGWRGASSANLADYPRAFSPDGTAQTFGLQTSWRNSQAILDAANSLCEPLRDDSPQGVGVLGPRPDAPAGEISCVYPESLDEEAAQVADWFVDRLSGKGSDQSAALLLRSRKHQLVFAEQLEKRGIPAHILGLGGLLGNPLVADLVAGIALIHRAQPNGELVRLLTSGRFRLGVADLFALAERARWLGVRDSGGEQLDDRLRDALNNQALGRPIASLVEALDYLSTVAPDHSHWSEFSQPGQAALREAHRLIERQRRVSHQGIVEQIAHWERLIGLDLEWRSHPDRDSYAQAREAFIDAVRQYQSVADDPGGRGFLDWLEQAEWRDSLQPQSAPAEPGCVQILTIHGAKGLEWDLVAVSRMVEGELPDRPNEGYLGWLSAGVLPYPFRGDRLYLPHLAWESAESRKDVRDRVEDFQAQVRAHHLREERRLAYVAITRAKSEVLLSGSWWASQKTASSPSVFLQELADAGHIDSLPEHSSLEEHPGLSSDEPMSWPTDPLGARRTAVEEAATRVREALERAEPESLSPQLQHISRSVAEYERSLIPIRASWPVRIPASQFAAWVSDPERLLRQRAQPRPVTTGSAQQKGNEFHSFVEDYFHEHGAGRLVSDIDIDSEASDELADLASWREAFVASEYSQRTPLALEREIHLPLSGHLIICKIDAVFEVAGRIEIVDWKTGRPPADPSDRAAKALQLALYRLAWSEWSGVPLEQIDALFWYSQTASTDRPAPLADRGELERLLNEAKAQTAEPISERGSNPASG